MTTASSQHQLLHIASERQLDDAGAGTLILFRLSVDEREGAGQSLVSLVSDVRSRAGSDPLALQELENKLIEAGYLDSQSHRYGSRGYTPRDSSFFRVSGDFPRITDRDLRPGVGDVRYTIAVTACLPHALAELEAHGLIGSKHEE